MNHLLRRKMIRLLTGGRKRRFGTAGLINVLATNIILQFLLAVGMLTGAATLISQMSNALFGYFLYSRYTFCNISYRKQQASARYTVMFLALWISNWAGIHSLTMFGISNSIAALLMIAPLACISYLTQKSWVFIEK